MGLYTTKTKDEVTVILGSDSHIFFLVYASHRKLLIDAEYITDIVL